MQIYEIAGDPNSYLYSASSVVRCFTLDCAAG
jgi:hypothetical protein